MDSFPEDLLAPAQLIQALVPSEDQRYARWQVNIPAGEMPDEAWPLVIDFHRECDEECLYTCSPRGLELWAAYVATDSDGTVTQFSMKPYPVEFGEPTYEMCWCVDMRSPARPAPSTHRYPGPARESLLRVNDV